MKLVLKAYWPSAVKHRWLFFAMSVCMVLTVLNKAAYPFLLRGLLQGLNDNSPESVTWILWLIGALFVSTNVIWYAYDLVIALFELRVMRDLSQQSFAVVQAQSMRFFENSFTGSLVTAARRFRNAFETITDGFAYQLGRSFTLIVLTLAVFAWEYPGLALVFGVWSIIFCGASIWIAKLRMKRDTLAAQEDSAVSGAFADSFSNEATVKSFSRERAEQERFNRVTDSCYRCYTKAWRFGIGLIRVQGVISSAFEVSVILLLIRGWHNGTVTAADFLFFQSYALILIAQVWDIGNTMHKIFRNVADAREMAEVFVKEPEVQDARYAPRLTVRAGKIEFHAVTFSYDDDRGERERHDVHGFTLKIFPGRTVALVGHSGAGKSTVVKLLERYIEPKAGYIRIDGQDIADVTQSSLRQQIALVPQQAELFHRTLRENIAFARPDAFEEEIVSAAKRARAWQFIQRLPQGLDTLVGERGVKLSGGERQRIALARAFLADAPILVLDEATNSLDSKTEDEIQAAIADLLEGRTCIVIAHRLSTIQHADRIVVMERGSIAEEGTHRELLRRGGVYADLWTRQRGGYINE